MKRILPAAAALLVLAGCRPPLQVTAEARRVAVRVTVTATVPGLDVRGGASIQAACQEQVKLRLGAGKLEVSDGGPDSVERPMLEIRILEVALADCPGKGAVLGGWLRDTTEEAVDDMVRRAATGDRGPIEHEGRLEDTLAGRYIVRGIRSHRLEALGYKPLLLSGRITFRGGGMVYTRDFDGWQLLPRMRPLPREGEGDQAPRIRREEARALAELALEGLGSRIGWSMTHDL
jgi:hypothetical protein